MRKFTFSQCIIGFELACRARHLSDHTISDYKNTFRKFAAWLPDDLPLKEITQAHLQHFFADQTVSKKSVANYHVALSALWEWAAKERLVPANILHQVERAKPEKRAIVPFSETDIRAMINAVNRSRAYTRPGKRQSDHELPAPERSLAIILLLLDTGIRATELCELAFPDVDFRNSRIKVFGKGSKERSIPFSPRTGQALWKYAATRKQDSFGDTFFLTDESRPLDRTQLYHRLEAIAGRAGVPQFNPHRFRHTFAINYLRNGGDPYTLQILLGHSSMDMVSRYLAIAQADLDAKHRRASPVENWRL